MSLAEFLPGAERSMADLLAQPGETADAFKGQDGVGRFIHPDTGIKIIAKRGEIDLKTTRLIPVFDAAKKSTE